MTYLAFTIMEAMIFDISSASLINSFTLGLETSSVSLLRHSQCFVSFADFNAIAKKFFQSFFEEPAFPSTTFAPIDVPLLTS
ncbi:MAG: hypothetical protein V4539_14365 [Bacteroidota bacterium]